MQAPGLKFEFERLVTLSAQILEGIGVATILFSCLVAVVIVSVKRAREQSWKGAYGEFRHALGRGILLGLEFLVGADIIRTVAEAPTLDKVVVLGLIVLVRTFLSFTLEVELEGRWPWQKRRRESTSRPDSDRPTKQRDDG